MVGYHEPVLLREVLAQLNCKSGGTYVDATLGGGGYAEAILDAISPNGVLIGFDRDEDSIEEARKRLGKFKERFRPVKACFSRIGEKLREFGVGKVDGIVADLGVSSHQLDSPERGFSFLSDAKLDMRMDKTGDVSAYGLVNSSSADQLADWFFEFGEERFSRRIAKGIVDERRNGPIETAKQLADIVIRSVPAPARRGRTHPATRVFQALRIVVNDELGELKRLVDVSPSLLGRSGRFVVVSYHSLEDRIVKRGFLELEKGGDFVRITKKPLRPSREEENNNRRSRSARLRAIEKV